MSQDRGKRGWHIRSPLAKSMTLVIEKGARFDDLAVWDALDNYILNMRSDEGSFLALKRSHPISMSGYGGNNDGYSAEGR